VKHSKITDHMDFKQSMWFY